MNLVVLGCASNNEAESFRQFGILCPNITPPMLAISFAGGIVSGSKEIK
jgi:hypothetical protein